MSAMNVIMMEKSDFDKLVGQIEVIAEHIRKNETAKIQDRAERWLSGEEVMGILGASPRTLQRYRSTGRIPYYKIGKKCLYRLSDVERALEMCSIDAGEESPDGLRRQYLVRTGRMPEISKNT